MEDSKIRVGITQGDINGVGYEVILKTFADPVMLELCTPIIYGSPKVAAYHRKSLDLPTNFSIVNSASEAVFNRLSVVNCTDDEVKVEFSKPDPEAGKAALGALEKAIEEFREGLIDVIVTAPINKHTIQSEGFSFPGHTEYIEERLGDGSKSLMILMKDDFRVALVTGHIPVRDIASTITKELIQEKIAIFNRSLKQDFGIGAPRIAVLQETRDYLVPKSKRSLSRQFRKWLLKEYFATVLIRLTDLWDRVTLLILMVCWLCIMTRDWHHSRPWLWMKG